MGLKQSVLVLFALIHLWGVRGMRGESIRLPHSVTAVIEVMKEPNTQYIIDGRIDLNGMNLIIPTNSELIFKGGKFTNGTIVGQMTKLSYTEKNVFDNCSITGTWQMESANSKMFSKKLAADVLLMNLSCLSNVIYLSAKRQYRIDRKSTLLKCQFLSTLERGKKVKIVIHSDDTDQYGLMFESEMITLQNIIFQDDFEKRVKEFPHNDHRVGCTVCGVAPKRKTQIVRIENCVFTGGTPSSYFASSTASECVVKNCTFSGYMADHAIYCSRMINSYIIDGCTVRDVPNTTGLFKIRTSDTLKEFLVQNVTVVNLNGYLAFLELMTGDANISFNHITVTKDTQKDYVFPGVCIIKDPRDVNALDNYNNAATVKFQDCRFDYGYKGRPLISRGAGKKAIIGEVVYSNVRSKDLSISEDNSDRVTILNSLFGW